MTYLLATMEDRVRWYTFGPDIMVADPAQAALLDILDLKRVHTFGTKDQAKATALAAGLRSWRYVRI